MSAMNLASPRDSVTSEHQLYDGNVSRELQPEQFFRIGDFMKKNCVSNPMIPKDIQTLNDKEANEEEQQRDLIQDSSQFQLGIVGLTLEPQHSHTNVMNSIRRQTSNQVSQRNENDQFFSLHEAIVSVECLQKKPSQNSTQKQYNVELSSEGIKTVILKAEQTAILKNTRHKDPLSTQSDHSKIKIRSLRHALNLVVLVSSFIDTIRQFGTQYKFKRLNKVDFSIIGDAASDYDFYFSKNFFLDNVPSGLRYCFIRFLLLLDNTPLLSIVKKKLFNEIDWRSTLILPNSLVKIIWDTFIFTLLTMNIFYVPIKITWEGSDSGKLVLSSWVSIFLNDIPGWAFLGDIIFNFNTAFYSKGAIICKRQEIVKNYLRTKFLGDLLIVIPFIVSLRLNLTLLNPILLLRTNKMFQMVTYFEQLLNFKQRQAAFYNLSKLVFMIIFVAHFCGCMFFLVASLENSYNLFDKTWIDKAGIAQLDWYEQYITSLYWAVITMITIGYGDITPITTLERIFVILITLISCGVFAYSLNQIGVLIQVLTQSENQIQQRMGLLVRHLKNRGVSNYLQMQVRKYFEYWHQGKDESEGEQCDLMIESLSANLRMEVQNDIRYRLINQMQLLKCNFSTPFLKKLSVHIKTKRSKPEEVLIEENDINDKLYFLVKGIVNATIAIERDGINGYTTVKPINPNSLFDQVSFMGERACLTAYRSLGACTLYYICKEDFMKEINNFPLDKERYQYIKDNINIYRTQRNIGTSCTFCEKHTHSFDRCPYIKYIPYAEKQLAIYRVSVEQIRGNHQRRQQTHSQTLHELCKTKERAVNYLIENNPFTNEEDLIERLELVNQGEEEFFRSFSIPIMRKEKEITSAGDLTESSVTNQQNNDTNNQNDNANNELFLLGRISKSQNSAATPQVTSNLELATQQINPSNSIQQAQQSNNPELFDIGNNNISNARRNSQNSIASNWELQQQNLIHNQGLIVSTLGTPRTKNNSNQQPPTQLQNNSSFIQSQYQQILNQAQQQVAHSQQYPTQSPTISPKQSPLLPNPMQLSQHLSPFENSEFNNAVNGGGFIENNDFPGNQTKPFGNNPKSTKQKSQSFHKQYGYSPQQTKLKTEEQLQPPQQQLQQQQYSSVSKLKGSTSLHSQNSLVSSKPYPLVPSTLKRLEEQNISPEFAFGETTGNNANNNQLMMSPEVSNFLGINTQQQRQKKDESDKKIMSILPSNMKRIVELRRASLLHGGNQTHFLSNFQNFTEADNNINNNNNGNPIQFMPNASNINNNLVNINNSNGNYHHSSSINNNPSGAGGFIHGQSQNNNQIQYMPRRNSIGSQYLQNQNPYLPASYLNQQQQQQYSLPPFQQIFDRINPFNQVISDNLEFMPLLELDQMKEFGVYFSSGNYQQVIERHETYKNKLYNKTQGQLKKSENKIQQIRQLQDIILKRNHHHQLHHQNTQRLGSSYFGGTRKGMTIDNSPVQSARSSALEHEGAMPVDRNQEHHIQ